MLQREIYTRSTHYPEKFMNYVFFLKQFDQLRLGKLTSNLTESNQILEI